MYLFGTTPTGTKVHFSNIEHTSSLGRTWAPTFCGSEMLEYSKVDAIDTLNADVLCRNCFRNYSWEMMKNAEKFYLGVREQLRSSHIGFIHTATIATGLSEYQKARNAVMAEQASRVLKTKKRKEK